jgi:hypothetical protein
MAEHFERKTRTLDPTEPVAAPAWHQQIEDGNVAHYDPETNAWDNPSFETAVVMLGEPHFGNPNRVRTNPITEQKENYFDESQIAVKIGGRAVEWLGWHQLTQCSAYRITDAAPKGGKA